METLKTPSASGAAGWLSCRNRIEKQSEMHGSILSIVSSAFCGLRTVKAQF